MIARDGDLDVRVGHGSFSLSAALGVGRRIPPVWQAGAVERAPRDPNVPRLPHPDALVDLLDSDLAGRLEQWAGEARVEDSARRRTRERWLRQQAEEEGNLVGVLVDLGERAVPVAVHSAYGRMHHGVVRAVGADFLLLNPDRATSVFVALHAVASIRTGPGQPPAVGDRLVRTRLSIVEVLVRFAADRERVSLVTGGDGQSISGTVRSVGQDVVTVGLDGSDRAGAAYVPLAAIREIVV